MKKMKTKRKCLNEFGKWLKIELTEHDMKQRDLAELMGVTEVSVSRWITGDRIPGGEQMEWVLNHFGYHIEIVQN